jgi:hypothetical protein
LYLVVYLQSPDLHRSSRRSDSRAKSRKSTSAGSNRSGKKSDNKGKSSSSKDKSRKDSPRDSGKRREKSGKLDKSRLNFKIIRLAKRFKVFTGIGF